MKVDMTGLFDDGYGTSADVEHMLDFFYTGGTALSFLPSTSC